MNRTSVVSSNVVSIGWEDQVLQVEFKSGIYNYAGVPEAVFAAAISAQSAGKFINAEVIPNYTATKQAA